MISDCGVARSLTDSSTDARGFEHLIGFKTIFHYKMVFELVLGSRSAIKTLVVGTSVVASEFTFASEVSNDRKRTNPTNDDQKEVKENRQKCFVDHAWLVQMVNALATLFHEVAAVIHVGFSLCAFGFFRAFFVFFRKFSRLIRKL